MESDGGEDDVSLAQLEQHELEDEDVEIEVDVYIWLNDVEHLVVQCRGHQENPNK